MPTAFVDANIIVGARYDRDQNHDAARPIFDAIDTGDLPCGRLLYSHLPESLIALERYAGKGTAVETLDGLEAGSGWRIEHPPKSIYSDAEALWKLHDGPEYSDAVIAAYLLHEGIEFVYSFDDDFDQIDGITRITTPTDPYA